MFRFNFFIKYIKNTSNLVINVFNRKLNYMPVLKENKQCLKK